MKNKILKLFSLTILLGILSACSAPSPIETNTFNVAFDNVNYEEDTAKFTVSGYPNDEELAQVSQIIVDSLDNQETEDTIKVSIYSDLQDDTADPFFGTVTYQDGKLDKDITIPSEEEYLEIASI